MSPSAVVHVVLAVVVAEHELVYGLCPVHDVVDERLAQRVLVRALGAVGGGYAYASHLALMYVVGTEEEVVLLVGVYDGRGPHCTLGPRHVFLVYDVRMLGPCHEVW